MKNILLADDDSDLTHLLSQRCYRLGYRASVANDALGAMVLLKHDRPDLAILDFEMPMGNGLMLAEIIRGESSLAAIPVILLTSQDTPTLRKRAASFGAIFVPKSEDVWSRLEPLIVELIGDKKPETSSVPAPKSFPAVRNANRPDLSEIFCAGRC